MEVLNPVTNQTWSTGSIACIDGSSRSTVKVRLDNTPPKADLTIDMVADGDYINNPAAATISPMAICGKMKSGVFIVGRFKAKDEGLNEHFYSYSFAVFPSYIGDIRTPQNFRHIPVAPVTEQYLLQVYLCLLHHHIQYHCLTVYGN